MSNYLNNNSFSGGPNKNESRYSVCDEKNQARWINQVAKQAAKLISKQIKESDNQSKKSK
ncbi:MAG: hypothetical protein IKT08_07590 [Bacteroidales bacterium]|nr:hypothetical protein [Bacteroidales bacterium]